MIVQCIAMLSYDLNWSVFKTICVGNSIKVYLWGQIAKIRLHPRPFNFENPNLTYGLGAIAWTCTWGWFWVHARNTAHLMPRSKNGSKYENFKKMR